MSPRILDVAHCPHCRADLPQPAPRMCPACGGSIQWRYQTAGCLTSAPKLLLACAAAWALLEFAASR